jgi:hypothetical protein
VTDPQPTDAEAFRAWALAELARQRSNGGTKTTVFVSHVPPDPPSAAAARSALRAREAEDNRDVNDLIRRLAVRLDGTRWVVG